MRIKASSTHRNYQFLALSIVLTCLALQACSHDGPNVKVGGNAASISDTLSFSDLETGGASEMPSRYFDTSMDYQGSTFITISFSKFVDRFNSANKADAVLLNCRDDYQGVLSIADIKKYDLRLATEIQISPNYKKPSWLNPLLVIVPDGQQPPKMERFMTANISELLFVRLADYYLPVTEIAEKFPESKKGLKVVQDNCLFCHSIKGVGGNKGIPLLGTYKFADTKDVARFRKDFAAFHNPGNEEKQNVDQYVTGAQLDEVANFLKAAQKETK
jgi:mono/diheme cytochrome c family protein